MLGQIVLIALGLLWLFNLIDETARDAGRAPWGSVATEGVGGVVAFTLALAIMLHSSPSKWNGAPLGLLCAMLLGGAGVAIWRANCAIAKVLNIIFRHYRAAQMKNAPPATQGQRGI